jgi:hypothetical protein
MGEGLELWLNRYEASLVLELLWYRQDRYEGEPDDATDKRLYKELYSRLSDLITEFDADQQKKKVDN